MSWPLTQSRPSLLITILKPYHRLFSNRKHAGVSQIPTKCVLTQFSSDTGPRPYRLETVSITFASCEWTKLSTLLPSEVERQSSCVHLSGFNNYLKRLMRLRRVCWLVLHQLGISWSHLKGGNVKRKNVSIRSCCKAFF